MQKLIQERLAPGADKAAVDRRIWDLFGEEWAVMFTDLAGFSRNAVEFGIIHFLQIIYESQRIFTPCIERHGGILLKTEGDSLLVIFRTARQAIECAVAMQQATYAYNVGRDEKEQILLGAGLGCGRMLRIGDQDVFGAEVNAASKLGEDTAREGEILVTDSVRDAAGPDFVFEPIEKIPPGAKAAFRLRYRIRSVMRGKPHIRSTHTDCHCEPPEGRRNADCLRMVWTALILSASKGNR